MPTDTFKLTDSEVVLEDDYPVYAGYIYIVDGVFMECSMEGTVSDIKRSNKVKEVRRCDLFAHKGARIGDRAE